MDHGACAEAALDALLCGIDWTPEQVRQRILDLIKANRTAGWAQSRLRVIEGMATDRASGKIEDPLDHAWLTAEVREIRKGIETVAEAEAKRRR